MQIVSVPAWALGAPTQVHLEPQSSIGAPAKLRRRLGAKLGAPTQVHLDASPPGGSCWNAIATAPIGAPAVAGCMRAWIYVWKVYACKYLHLRRCRWTFFGFPCWGVPGAGAVLAFD